VVDQLATTSGDRQQRGDEQGGGHGGGRDAAAEDTGRPPTDQSNGSGYERNHYCADNDNDNGELSDDLRRDLPRPICVPLGSRRSRVGSLLAVWETHDAVSV